MAENWGSSFWLVEQQAIENLSPISSGFSRTKHASSWLHECIAPLLRIKQIGARSSGPSRGGDTYLEQPTDDQKKRKKKTKEPKKKQKSGKKNSELVRAQFFFTSFFFYLVPRFTTLPHAQRLSHDVAGRVSRDHNLRPDRRDDHEAPRVDQRVRRKKRLRRDGWLGIKRKKTRGAPHLPSLSLHVICSFRLLERVGAIEDASHMQRDEAIKRKRERKRKEGEKRRN